jgi:polyhydroxyalkanoate synthase
VAEDRKAEGQTGTSTDGFPGFDPKSVDPYIVKDPEAFTINLARTVEQLGKAASAWLAPRESGEKTDMAGRPDGRHGQDPLQSIRILALRSEAYA